MKRLFSLLLVMVMVLGMAACGSKNPPPSTGSNPSSGGSNTSSGSQTPAGSTGTDGWQKTITLSDGSTYPNGTITFIAPFSAGGSVDLGVRLLTKYAAKYTDATMIVENITGGSGLVGTQTGLSRPADGNTIWHLAADGQYVTTSNSVCPFDVMKDMTIVGSMVADDRVWVAQNDETRFTNAEELFKYATDHPGEISVSTSGSGTLPTISTIYVQNAVGCEFNPIAYNGASEAKAAFLGGHNDIYATSGADVESMIQENQGKILFSLTDERIYDDVPTVKELGYDLTSLTTIRGFAMRADVDPAIAAYWEQIISMVTSDPEFLQEAANMKLTIRYMDAAAATQTFDEYYKIIYDIKEDLGI